MHQTQAHQLASSMPTASAPARSSSTARTIVTVGRKLGVEVWRAYISIAGDVRSSTHLSEGAARTWVQETLRRLNVRSGA